MKLSSDEGRALAFIVGLIALAGLARVVTRPGPADAPPAAEVDASALEHASDSALQRQKVLARPLGADERIDVNAAAADELDRLPGVGATLAQRILEERERGGAYDSPADLRAVPGLGAALLARLESHLAFGPGPGLSRRLPAPVPDTDVATNPTDHTAPPSSGNGRRRTRRGADDAPVAHPLPQPRPPSPGERLDLNRASAAQLEALPGIGPALAARIVAKRDSLNGFRSVDELVQVRGIGPVLLARLKPYLRT